MNFKYEYVINGASHSEQKVSADSYGLSDGFFNFMDSDKVKVFSVRADKVATIQRTDAAK